MPATQRAHLTAGYYDPVTVCGRKVASGNAEWTLEQRVQRSHHILAD